ncbi:MAG TPA: YdbC family protein [Candidatus Mcinerneyibacteriales bacterium]|nr:YdbC family protein [Candidatus Mcinerneyibacteriales bacterium]
MADITVEIVQEIGVLSESNKGWTKELNLVSWNGREPKYDLREWDPDHEKMSKGITLTKDEARRLRDYLNGIGL